MAELIEFFGEGCADCIIQKPIVERLEKELSVKIKRLEVWKNSKNRKLMDKLTGGATTIPAFVNKKTGQILLDHQPYEKLKKWVLGENA